MEIVKDGILVPDAPLLCWLGIHRWRYFSMAETFVAAFPHEPRINRQCLKCGLTENTPENGTKWRARL